MRSMCLDLPGYSTPDCEHFELSVARVHPRYALVDIVTRRSGLGVVKPLATRNRVKVRSHDKLSFSRIVVCCIHFQCTGVGLPRINV